MKHKEETSITSNTYLSTRTLFIVISIILTVGAILFVLTAWLSGDNESLVLIGFGMTIVLPCLLVVNDKMNLRKDHDDK